MALKPANTHTQAVRQTMLRNPAVVSETHNLYWLSFKMPVLVSYKLFRLLQTALLVKNDKNYTFTEDYTNPGASKKLNLVMKMEKELISSSIDWSGKGINHKIFYIISSIRPAVVL